MDFVLQGHRRAGVRARSGLLKSTGPDYLDSPGPLATPSTFPSQLGLGPTPGGRALSSGSGSGGDRRPEQ